MPDDYVHGTYVDPIVNAPRSKQSQEALDEMLPPEERRMGRPSQGRSSRLQVNVTPEIVTWLEANRSPDDKSISDVVFHLLEGVRQSK